MTKSIKLNDSDISNFCHAISQEAFGNRLAGTGSEVIDQRQTLEINNGLSMAELEAYKRNRLGVF